MKGVLATIGLFLLALAVLFLKEHFAEAIFASSRNYQMWWELAPVIILQAAVTCATVSFFYYLSKRNPGHS